MTQRAWRKFTSAHASVCAATALVVATFLAVLLTTSSATSWAASAQLASLILLPAALASSVFLCIATRLYPSDSLPVPTAAVTVLGIQGLPMLAAAEPSMPLGEPVLLFSSLSAGLVVLWAVYAARPRWVRSAPIGFGVAIGLALLVGRAAIARILDAQSPRDLRAALGLTTGYADLVACVFVLLIGATAALAVHTRCRLPSGKRRLAAAVLLWSTAQALQITGWTDTAGWAMVAVIAGITAGVLLGGAAIDVLWRAVSDDQRAVLQLQHQLRHLRDHAQERSEQLHEVKGSIAGIASATDLIQSERLSSQHRERLEELVAAETARLQRLVHADSPVTPDLVPLERVVEQLVNSHRLLGQHITWEPPERPVAVCADGLADAVSILLQNASQHAPGSSVVLAVRERDEHVELVVSDDGPGVPDDLRSRVFEWGWSRPGSPGDGIGLAMASRILSERGHSIRLDPERERGTAFVIRLATKADGSGAGDTPVLAS